MTLQSCLRAGHGQQSTLTLMHVPQQPHKSPVKHFQIPPIVNPRQQHPEHVKPHLLSLHQPHDRLPMFVFVRYGIPRQATVQQHAQHLGAEFHQFNVGIARKVSRVGNAPDEIPQVPMVRIVRNDRIQKGVEQTGGIGRVGSDGHGHPPRRQGIVLVRRRKQGVGTGGEEEAQHLDPILVVFPRVRRFGIQLFRSLCRCFRSLALLAILRPLQQSMGIAHPHQTLAIRREPHPRRPHNPRGPRRQSNPPSNLSWAAESSLRLPFPVGPFQSCRLVVVLLGILGGQRIIVAVGGGEKVVEGGAVLFVEFAGELGEE
mmetsp:Transcript_18956/g.34941  ORF Transcript_18956/g.34941 Transcript_18956/m.34941 type:complete len:315 (-) Transcript_18956:507-1451(-)